MMTIISKILILCDLFLVASIYGMYLIYRAQITEYNIVRFKAMLKDAGWRRVLFPRKFHRPAISFHNLLIFSIYITLWLFLLVVGYSFWWLVIFLFMLAFFLSFLFVWISVVVSNPIAHFLHKRKIRRATLIISNMHNLKVIGITGSFGKTSVKNFFSRVIRSKI